MERLMHFSSKPVLSVYSVEQDRSHEQWRRDKPRGLWVSVEGNGDGWSDWCTSEGYGLGGIPHVVGIAADARVLRLTSASCIDRFTAEFGEDPSWGRPTYYHPRSYGIAWDKVASLYQGILIAPYCWERRLYDGSPWYYGWDCASGCIWDSVAIAEILPVPVPSEDAA